MKIKYFNIESKTDFTAQLMFVDGDIHSKIFHYHRPDNPEENICTLYNFYPPSKISVQKLNQIWVELFIDLYENYPYTPGQIMEFQYNLELSENDIDELDDIINTWDLCLFLKDRNISLQRKWEQYS